MIGAYSPSHGIKLTQQDAEFRRKKLISTLKHSKVTSLLTFKVCLEKYKDYERCYKENIKPYLKMRDALIAAENKLRIDDKIPQLSSVDPSVRPTRIRQGDLKNIADEVGHQLPSGILELPDDIDAPDVSHDLAAETGEIIVLSQNKWRILLFVFILMLIFMTYNVAHIECNNRTLSSKPATSNAADAQHDNTYGL